jgi:hypothetical protein
VEIYGRTIGNRGEMQTPSGGAWRDLRAVDLRRGVSLCRKVCAVYSSDPSLSPASSARRALPQLSSIPTSSGH